MSIRAIAHPRRPWLQLAAAFAGVGLLSVSTPAFAAGGSIDHVETVKSKIKVLYSLRGAGAEKPDLGSLRVSLNGQQLDASAALASDATNAVRRTAVLAVDVSNSMLANGKFAEAKRAAQTFLDSAPKDLYIGIVTFAGKVKVVQPPTLDRSASTAVLSSLKTSQGTFLYDGLKQAAASAGRQGQRSVIVLSDGRDQSTTELSTVTRAVKSAGVKVDVVTLDQSARDRSLLTPLSDAGSGAVIAANDPKGLSGVFASEARALARQIQITATAPRGRSEGSLVVEVDAGGQHYTDSAFVTLRRQAEPKPSAALASTKLSVAPRGFSLPPTVLVGGLAAIGLGALVVMVGLFGGFGKPKESLESRIDAYTQRGQGKRVAAASGPLPAQGVAAQAVGIANKALKSSSGFETKLGDRLDGAGLALKPAEWLLVHAGIAVSLTAVLFAFSGGSILMSLGGLTAGVFLPWMFLGFKRSRRLKAFNGQLAGCLQLMAGSLKAGLSLAQSLDGVVREGQDPLSGEFRRALVETRLGVPIEDALESIGDRMESPDFEWTVMAIKIQRDVGGNLAELLLNVAATLREREYLRRQVKALSAEGRFSAYILLALPPCIILYMASTNPTYLSPLTHTPMGYFMIGIMVSLMMLGAFTMKKIVKVEV